MGFLKCKSCGGCYELQEGELPGDFELCQCGGELEFYDSQGRKRLYNSYHHERVSNSFPANLLTIIFLVGIVLTGLFLVYPFVMMFGGMVFFDWKFGGGLSAGGYIIIILLLALVGSAIFTGYYLFKIILRANS